MLESQEVHLLVLDVMTAQTGTESEPPLKFERTTASRLLSCPLNLRTRIRFWD